MDSFVTVDTKDDGLVDGEKFLSAGSLYRFDPRKWLDSQCEEVEPMG